MNKLFMYIYIYTYTIYLYIHILKIGLEYIICKNIVKDLTILRIPQQLLCIIVDL